MPEPAPRIYFDESTQKWMVDDCGRPREATPEEIEQATATWNQQQQ